METKQIFKEGDRVFDFEFGPGRILKVEPAKYFSIQVYFDGICRSYTKDGRSCAHGEKRLSFKKYDLVNGGFSQERSREMPEVGEIVFTESVGSEFGLLIPRVVHEILPDEKISCLVDPPLQQVPIKRTMAFSKWMTIEEFEKAVKLKFPEYYEK